MIKIVKVYIVEDDEDLQDIYKIFLSLMGCEIVGLKANGDEALIDLYFNYKDFPPDILIVDHHLQGKKGLVLLEDLKNLNSLDKTRVLFITCALETRIEALKLGASRFILKPCNINLLGKTIQEVIEENELSLLIPSN